MGYKLSDFPPSVQKRILDQMVPVATPELGQVAQSNVKRKGVQNKTEQDFYESYLLPRIQSGEFYSAKYEALALPIAHRCVYNPDFIVGTAENTTVIFETKAPHRFRNAGIIKLKVAAQAYPEYEFYLAEKKDKKWVVKRIPRDPSLKPRAQSEFIDDD